MTDLIQDLASQLQSLVAERRGVRAPILDHRWAKDAQVPAEPTIRITMWSAGDMYSGGTLTETITLLNMPRPDIGAALSAELTFAQHDLSGQCDQWSLEIRGAAPAEVDALRAMFPPAKHNPQMGENRAPKLEVDGVEQPW